MSSVNGIALNSQEIELFNLLGDNEAVIQYLKDIWEGSSGRYKGRNIAEKLDAVILGETEFQGKEKDAFEKLVLENVKDIRKNWGSKEALLGMGISEKDADAIFKIKKFFNYQTHGILSFLVDKNGNTIDTSKVKFEEAESVIDVEKTLSKVQAVYDMATKSGHTHLSLDSQGKFGTVAGLINDDKTATNEDYNLLPLREGFEFAKKHGMKNVRINALVFFQDFPGRLLGENKDTCKAALLNYGKAVATVIKEYQAQGIDVAVDVFNEFVDYHDAHRERTNAWHSKFSIEELCEIAAEMKKEMSGVDFSYNDWNFEDNEKRASIFKVLEKIQAYERAQGIKIIDSVGMQCHTNINKHNKLGVVFEELARFGLPVDITELDISKGLDGIDRVGAEQKAKVGDTAEIEAIEKYEQYLQNKMMQEIKALQGKGLIRSVTAWSITDELCADFAEGLEASPFEMKFDGEGFTCEPKDFGRKIAISQAEVDSVYALKKRAEEKVKSEARVEPVQEFSYHNHTARCGHAAGGFPSVEDFVRGAIKGGYRKMAFTDHMPLPDAFNKEPNMRMSMSEVDSYLADIARASALYADKIDVEAGFEIEFTYREFKGEMNEGKNHYEELRRACEEKGLPCKLVLGQHHVQGKDGRIQKIERGEDGKQLELRHLSAYSEMILKAMQEGIPDIIAHPDYFMEARNNFGPAEEMISRMLVRGALKTGIPMEINLGQIGKQYREGKPIEAYKIDYPSAEFWRVAAEESELAVSKAKARGEDIAPLRVVFGTDAHSKGQLEETKLYEVARGIIGDDTLSRLNFVGPDLVTPDPGIKDRLGIRKLEEGPEVSKEAEAKEEEIK